MIHFVTQKIALTDCIAWLQPNDRVVLFGDCVANSSLIFDRYSTSVVVAAFCDDAERVGSDRITRINGATLVEWLEASPCRTWS